MHLYVITNPAKTIIVSVISKHNVPWLKSSLTEVSQCVTIEPKLSKGFEVLALYEKKKDVSWTYHPCFDSWTWKLNLWLYNSPRCTNIGFSGCTFCPLQAPNAHFSLLKGRTLLARIILQTLEQTNYTSPNQAFTSSKYYSTALQ